MLFYLKFIIPLKDIKSVVFVKFTTTTTEPLEWGPSSAVSHGQTRPISPTQSNTDNYHLGLAPLHNAFLLISISISSEGLVIGLDTNLRKQ